MHKLLFLIIFIGFVSRPNLFAQEKFEKESRIKQAEVPSSALVFTESLNINTRIKWYKEESLNSTSIEAKFKHLDAKYSIEFDSMGNLEDMEREVNWKNVEKSVSNPIINQLEMECTNFKIVKVQEQYSGNSSDLALLLRDGKRSEGLQLKYEVVAKCSKQKVVHLFEFLFNEKFVLERKSQIIFKSSSHLEY